MTRIPAHHAADLYARLGAAQAAQQSAHPQAPAEPRAPAAPAAEAARADGLTTAERTAIARYFPEQPQVTLRLYGPGRDVQTVRPDAVGGRLDLRA
ncbi:MAG: hypothetical protein R3362_12390 [Rhodothermales bacterium]|nr:hypothetical protein [Rhodothermales bacterium]